MTEHYCISCGLVDEGPKAQCRCMDEGDPCAVCGEPQYVPLTPWKANYHDDSDHEFVRQASTKEDGDE